jgi:hypothetical protein
MPNMFSLDYHTSLVTGNNGVVAISDSIKEGKGRLIYGFAQTRGTVAARAQS